MKRYWLFLCAGAAFAFSMICFWYADVLFNRFFVLGLIPLGFSFVILMGCGAVSVVHFVRGKGRWLSMLSLLICILTVVLICVFPFRISKVKTELILFEKDRMQVVELISEGQLTADAYGNVRLPWKHQRTSSDGTVHVYRNDGEQVICFWVFRGMLSGSVQLIYSSQDESLIRDNERMDTIVSMSKLKDHWYLIETGD